MERKHDYNLRNILLMSGAVILAMFIIAGYVWTQIPAGQEVCIHWNIAGECDDYGSKFMSILLMPIIVLGTVIMLALLPRIEPRANHIAQSHKAYIAVWSVLLLFFLGLYIILMLDVLGYGTSANITTILPILLGVLLIVIGNYLGKVRSNFFMGIRTPWTLSSELSWNKTHRLGGKLFMLQGILCLAGAIFLGSETWLYLLVGGIIALTLFLVIYSYVVWKNDEERHG